MKHTDHRGAVPSNHGQLSPFNVFPGALKELTGVRVVTAECFRVVPRNGMVESFQTDLGFVEVGVDDLCVGTITPIESFPQESFELCREALMMPRTVAEDALRFAPWPAGFARPLLVLWISVACGFAFTQTRVWSADHAHQFEPVSVAPSSWLQDQDADLDDLEDSDLDDLDLDLDDPEESEDGPGLNRSIYGDPEERQPTVEGGRLVLPPLRAPTTDLASIGNGKLPESFRGDAPAPEISLPESLFERGLPGGYTIRHWAAPNTFSHPRYFEDRMLERHGHEGLACVQPFASGFRFFATVPMLPYLMTVRPACDCEYTLGYYRSGSCAPVMLQRPPYETKAALAEALWISGVSGALP